MNELPSTEFRKRFARLTEPTIVTANGHHIGTWIPAAAGVPASGSVTAAQIKAGLDNWKGLSAQAAQAQRDQLLNKINRGK